MRVTPRTDVNEANFHFVTCSFKLQIIYKTKANVQLPETTYSLDAKNVRA